MRRGVTEKTSPHSTQVAETSAMQQQIYTKQNLIETFLKPP